MIARSTQTLCAQLDNGMLGKAWLHTDRHHNAGGHITRTGRQAISLSRGGCLQL